MTQATAERDVTTVISPLSPLREALLAQAGAEAAGRRAAAEAAGHAALAAAEAEAARQVEQARAAGRIQAGAELTAKAAEAREAARRLTLATRREGYEELVRRVTARIRDLAATPEFRSWVSVRASELLGPGVRVEPAAGGGLFASSGDGRHIDASVGALAAAALAVIDLEPLWSP